MLVKGRLVLVDPQFEPLAQLFNWFIVRDGRNEYVTTNGSIAGKRRMIPMHRLLTGFSSLQVDHINGNGLDNRLCNLRLCSARENQRNSRVPINSNSGYRGVYMVHGSTKWRARTKVDGKMKHLGVFDDPRDAAMAYDKFAIENFGEFARTNFDALNPPLSGPVTEEGKNG